MGNQQTQEQQVLNHFDLSEITDSQTEGIEKRNILIDQKDGELVYYLVTDRTVEKMTNAVNNKFKAPIFAIGETSPPITHSLLIRQNQRCPQIEGNQEQCRSGVLIILIFSDCKLAVLSGEGLELLKTIQLFAPLDAFRVSLIYEMNFNIKEDVLHKQKQTELVEELMKQRQDFQDLFKQSDNESTQEESNVEQPRKQSKEVEQTRKSSNSEQARKNSKAEQARRDSKEQKEKEQKKQDEEERKDQDQSDQQREKSKSVSNIAKTDEQKQTYNEFLKAQYEIFVQASKYATLELLNIQQICYASKSIILVGYKCGLIQKVTVEKNLIEVQDECIFFNPLNLKPKSELEEIIGKSEEQVSVSWDNLNILQLQNFHCINSTYVIAIHQQQASNSKKSVEQTTTNKQSLYKTLVYVYEYQYGRKVSYFEGTQHKIIKTLVNQNEETNKNILYILDEQYNLYLYNFEKGIFLQSFSLDSSNKFIDFNAHFFLKEQMFAQISDKFSLLQNLPKFEDKAIEGDIFLYFTSDGRILITQLDFKPATQSIPQGNGQPPVVKKIINQRHLKMLSSKIPCKYKTSVYYPEQDILFIAGENGQILRFMNFLASIYYFL